MLKYSKTPLTRSLSLHIFIHTYIKLKCDFSSGLDESERIQCLK